VPGDHCQFCRAKHTCRARGDFVNEVAALEFRPAALYTDEELELFLSRSGNLKAWVNDLEQYFTERAIKENKIPRGYKLAAGKTHRKISDENLAVAVLTDKGFAEEDIFEPRSLKSVAKLEKLSQKGHVASLLGGLIVRPEGSMKLIKDDNVAAEDFK